MITCLEKGRRQVGGKAWRVEEKAGIEGGKVGRWEGRWERRAEEKGGREREVGIKKGREIEEEGVKRKSKRTLIIVRVSP